jgi:hypothetical protein
MAKPRKFSLVRSSKRNRPSISNPTPRAPENSQLSKAERILGTGPSGRKSPSGLAPYLNPKSSFSGFRTPFSDPEDFSDGDDMKAPTRFEDVVIPPRQGSLRQRASSSNVLGAVDENYTESIASTYTYTQRIRDSRSNLTLKSFYDAQKLPLEVTQQTSASAIRDRALRKGKDPVVAGTTVRKGLEESRPKAAEGRETEDERSGNGKKRPNRLDLSRLFPRSHNSSSKIFSPSKSPYSTASPSHTSEYFPHPAQTTRRKNSSLSVTGTPGETNTVRKNSWASKATTLPSITQRSQPEEDDFTAIKTNVRRPPMGAQNWFDGLLEEEDERDLELQHEISTPSAEQFTPQDTHTNFHNRSVESFDPSLVYPEPTYVSSPSRSPRDSEYSEIAPHAFTTPFDAESTQSVRTKGSRFGSSDLGDTSILSTTSSDEDGSGYDSVDPRVQIAEVDSVLIGKAKAFELKPRRKPEQQPVLEHGRQASENSNISVVSDTTAPDNSSLRSSNNGSTYLTVPRTRSRARKSGHTRQPSSIPEDSDDAPSTSTASISPPRKQSLRSLQGETHKLMAVTEEEEALLEMMRRKRAAMAKHSFAEGYKTALRKDVKNPKTPPRRPSKITPPRTARAVRPLSTSSSILDSFPVSRSQRGSYISNSSKANLFLVATGSPQSIPREHARQPRRTLTQTPSLASPFDSPTSSNYVFPPLSSAPVDVTLSPTPSPTLANHHGATSPSPEPLPSPSTPDTMRSSADIVFRIAGSQRESLNSATHMGPTAEGLENDPKVRPPRFISHVRRRTASSDANMLSSDCESECGMGDAIDPAIQRKGNKTSIASFSEVLKRSSMLGVSGHGPSRNNFSDQNSTLVNAEGTGVNFEQHCSVSEDVLAAWNSLGGWSDVRT